MEYNLPRGKVAFAPTARVAGLVIVFLFLFTLILPVISRAAAPPVVHQAGIEQYSLDLNLDILEDPEGTLTFNEVRRRDHADFFRPCLKRKPNWGFSSSVFWARFTLTNGFDKDKEWLLEFEYPLLNEITVFIPDGSGGYLARATGTSLPFPEREIKNRNLLVSIPHSGLSGGTFYVRVRSESTISLPMTLWSARAFIKADHHEQFILGVYYGIILVMIIYSVLLFAGLRERSYLYHLFFIINFGIFEMMMNGTAYEYLWPNQVWWNSHALPFFITLACIGACLFTRRFLESWKNHPLLDRSLVATAVVSGLASFFPFIVSYASSIKVAATLALVSITFILAAGAACLMRGCRQARWFMAAWTMFCLGIIILVFRAFGALNNEAFYFYGPQAGSALTVILLALALTDRIKLMQEKNLEVQLQYRSIFDNSIEGIFRLTAEGKIVMVNPALARMFGYESPEAVLVADPDISTSDLYVYPEHRDILRRDLFSQGVVSNFETEMRHRDGHSVNVLINISAIRDPHGEVLFLEGIIADITERKRIEDMRMARNAATMANKAKSRFLAAMSHEIRTPMNGVIGFTDILAKMEMPADQRRYLGLVKDSADRLMRIINDILDFSKIEAGKFRLETIPFDLEATLASPLELLKIKARDKGLALKWHIEEGAPTRLLGDPTRLSQVVINLIDNAIKFTHKGEVKLLVSEESREENEVVLHFLVSDTGIGIKGDAARKIFEPFTQADDSTTRKYGGSGLGLAISAELVSLMGGRIWVAAGSGEGGGGSMFHFTARFSLDIAPIVEVAAATELTPAAISDRHLNILLVDDEEINRILVSELLKQYGITVVEARSGRDALQNIADVSYDLVLMDVEMPEMNGFVVTKKIRSLEGDGSRVPIIAMTAHAVDGYEEKCLESGMDGYISKPFNPDKLLEMIDRFCP